MPPTGIFAEVVSIERGGTRTTPLNDHDLGNILLLWALDDFTAGQVRTMLAITVSTSADTDLQAMRTVALAAPSRVEYAMRVGAALDLYRRQIMLQLGGIADDDAAEAAIRTALGL